MIDPLRHDPRRARRPVAGRLAIERLRLVEQGPKRSMRVSTDGPEADRDRRGAVPRSVYSPSMQQMYHPDDLASMDPLVLMKNLDHVRMTSRRVAQAPPRSTL